jgi:hypothetical protein
VPSSIYSDQQLTAALKYAERGFSVFPMYEPTADLTGCSCHKKQNCPHPGKHPRPQNGFKSATTDEAKITAWWTKNPNANIGIVTGRISNLVVIDVDDRNGGAETLEGLETTHKMLPPTLTAATGNGLHYYFRAPQTELRSSSGTLGDGIDLRADGGCVVAPPSLHSNGKLYEFVDPSQPIAELPTWMVRLASSKRDDPAPEDESTIHAGSRNDHLVRIGGRLRYEGQSGEQILAKLLVANTARCYPPLAENEVASIADSMAKYPVGTNPQVARPSVPSIENPLWWFPINLRWWHENQAIALMDAEQIGWYWSLLVRAWPQRGQLPSNMAELATLARAKSANAFARKADLVLQEFEEREIGGKIVLVHILLETRYAEQFSKWEQTKAAGIASSDARKRKKEQEAA